MFDPTKPVQQRNGLAARVLAHDIRAADGQPIVAAAETYEGVEEVWTYQPNGRFGSRNGESTLDLVNVCPPPKSMGEVLDVIEQAIRATSEPHSRAVMVLDRLIEHGLIPTPPIPPKGLA